VPDYKPLSVRRGLRPEITAQEGIPDHLRYPVRYWLEGRYGFRDRERPEFMMDVAVAVGIQVDPSYESGGIMDQIIGAAESDADLCLDILDATLHIANGAEANSLRRLLDAGGSAWTVAADGKSIQRRVDATTAAAAAQAIAPADQASAELAEAWAKVYGLSPDPSDAWDHAIKAIEAVLIPIVVPAKTKATLGDVLGVMRANPGGWTFTLGTSSTTVGPVETVEAMLKMMWPNPDRHGGGGGSRVPSLAEAEAVVQLAVVVVSWCRSGAFAKK
jgi:hypothetical protein